MRRKTHIRLMRYCTFVRVILIPRRVKVDMICCPCLVILEVLPYISCDMGRDRQLQSTTMSFKVSMGFHKDLGG